jgi:xanthine dehydrogenase molybdenum-binding subunit
MTHGELPGIFRTALHYVGDLVAAVVADSEDIADEALERITVEYEKKPFVLDLAGAIKPARPRPSRARTTATTGSSMPF